MFGALLEGLIDLVAPRRCAACDDVLDPGRVGFCDACEPLLDRDPSGQGAFLYGGPMADAIRRYKYGGRDELSAPLGALLASAAGRFAGRVDAVVAVPLHPRRLAARGFDQTALLSRPVAKALGVPRGTLLCRTRDTPAQAGLDLAGRAQNVRGAFVARPCAGRVLLLDDVRTTGATLAACAEALTAAGASRVVTFVLAVVEG